MHSGPGRPPYSTSSTRPGRHRRPPGTPGTDLVVTKVDQVSGDPLDTATFQLYGDDGDGVFTEADSAQGTPQQTSNGQVSWNDLPVGTYFVQETAAPRGYGKAAPLTVVVDASQSGQTIRRDIADPRLPTTLQVLKGDDVTHQPLAGATFRVFADSNGNGRGDTGEPQVGELADHRHARAGLLARGRVRQATWSRRPLPRTGTTCPRTTP